MSKLREHLSEQRIRELIEDIQWYHSMDLNGYKTEGYDVYLVLDHFGIPESLEGKTVLDVGPASGYFSFVFERRKAESVLAIDVDQFDGEVGADRSAVQRDKYEESSRQRCLQLMEKYPDVRELLGLNGIIPMEIAMDLLDSRVERINLSVYDLDPNQHNFDFVFCGSVIGHLKNPIEATEKLAAVTNELCIIVLNGAIRPWPSLKGAEWLSKATRRFRLYLNDRDPIYKVNYVGNQVGKSFFRFHPLAYKELCLASGFKKVEIYSEIVKDKQLGDKKKKVYLPVFHCYV